MEGLGVFYLLLILGLFFSFWEFKRPYRTDSERLRFLHLDTISFGIIILGEFISRNTLPRFYQAPDIQKYLNPLEAPLVIKLVLSFLISDFILYWVHRASHSYRFLWRTHMWHHSTQGLYWFSGLRSSLVETLIYAIPQTLPGFVIFRFTMPEIGILFGVGLFMQFWSHSNMTMPKWLPLHWVFVTPDFHHPHHSKSEMSNRNFGSMLSVWDWIFGTGLKPLENRYSFSYGIKEDRSLWRLMLGV